MNEVIFAKSERCTRFCLESWHLSQQQAERIFRTQIKVLKHTQFSKDFAKDNTNIIQLGQPIFSDLSTFDYRLGLPGEGCSIASWWWLDRWYQRLWTRTGLGGWHGWRPTPSWFWNQSNESCVQETVYMKKMVGVLNGQEGDLRVPAGRHEPHDRLQQRGGRPQLSRQAVRAAGDFCVWRGFF